MTDTEAQACANWLPDALAAERPRLVGLCARLSGDWQAADDLAQETLLEAWRQAGKLREASGLAPWLSAIARHVCRRWRSNRARELPTVTLADMPATGEIEIEIELERGELAELLDRALASLPTATCQALLARYLHGSPHAAIAARLGVSEEAVKMRVQRGRLALQRTLARDFAAEAASWGLVDPSHGWREMRLWCPRCGQRRLAGRLRQAPARLEVRCPACPGALGNYSYAEDDELLAGVAALKPAINRVKRWAEAYYRPALARGWGHCSSCGREVPARLVTPADHDLPGEVTPGWGVLVSCPACGGYNWTRLYTLALCWPAGEAFWRAHPRLRLLPEREIEHDGRAAIVTSFASVTAAGQLDIIVTRDTFELLGAHVAGGG